MMQITGWGLRLTKPQERNPFKGLRPFPEIFEDNRFLQLQQLLVRCAGVGRGGSMSCTAELLLVLCVDGCSATSASR